MRRLRPPYSVRDQDGVTSIATNLFSAIGRLLRLRLNHGKHVRLRFAEA